MRSITGWHFSAKVSTKVLVRPLLVTKGEDHRVLVMHQLDNGHLHVRGGVPGQVEVFPSGVAGVVVADRVVVLAHAGHLLLQNKVPSKDHT